MSVFSQIAANETMKRGVHAIVFAFFDDSEAMRRQAELCLSAGVAGVAALGLATEVAKLSFAERCRIIDWTAEDVNRCAALGFTISGSSVTEQVTLLRHAEVPPAIDFVVRLLAHLVCYGKRLVERLQPFAAFTA